MEQNMEVVMRTKDGDEIKGVKINKNPENIVTLPTHIVLEISKKRIFEIREPFTIVCAYYPNLIYLEAIVISQESNKIEVKNNIQKRQFVRSKIPKAGLFGLIFILSYSIVL